MNLISQNLSVYERWQQSGHVVACASRAAAIEMNSNSNR